MTHLLSTYIKRLTYLGIVSIASASLLSGCQSISSTTHGDNTSSKNATVKENTGAELVKDLVWVEENHHVMSVGQGKYTQTFILDSYIIPFKQPYYILVRKQDGSPFIKHAAEVVALEYIEPRGCTQPLKRRVDLDKQNADGSAYLIGVAC